MNTTQPIVNFAPYIRNVLKQVHPKMGITLNALTQLNALLNMVGSKVAEKASFLTGHKMTKKMLKKKKGTCDSRSIQSAVRLTLPGEIGKHAVSEGTKAITKFSAYEHTPNPEPGKKRKTVQRSVQAGLHFSISRVEKIIRSQHCNRVGGGAPIYLAAVLEYLAAEFLELSGNSAIDAKRARIKVRDLQLATLNDEELNKLLSDWNWVGGGVLPNIHRVLLPKRTIARS